MRDCFFAREKQVSDICKAKRYICTDGGCFIVVIVLLINNFG